ncbi:MAG: ribonuclease R [Candidatus Solibacter sp.]|nr:ribonuclease R [Candidatus Solibacter sp.]
MSRPDPAWDKAIVERLEAQPKGRATARHLFKELRVRGEDRQRFEDALDALARRGALIEIRGQYVLPSRTSEYAVGRLVMHRDGYGFVVPSAPVPGVKGDVFIPPDPSSSAMHGDRVLARIARVLPDGKAEGSIERILRRAHPTVVGEFKIGRKFNYVIPQESRIQHTIVIPDGLEFSAAAANPDRIGAPPPKLLSIEDLDGQIVNVELLGFPDRGQDAAGRIIEILGHPDDFGVDVEITIRKHHLPNRFPAEVLSEAQAIGETIPGSEIARRRDFRHLDCVTIDGETARDFDDAVWVHRAPDGNFILHVHIADVSHYVRPGSAIDNEALIRGTSVYFPDRAVPMLPLELSTGICSLRPQVDRLVMSALLEIDHQGQTVRQEFCRGVIRSAERMTYTGVFSILEGDPALRARYAPLVPRFELMRDLALILQRKRRKRGSIDFDLPEPSIVFDENGLMTSIDRAPRNIAHRLIEEFMLAANEAVSAHLEASLPQSIFRVHEVPDPQKVMDFEDLAARFGYSLGFGAVPVKRFPAVTRASDGRKLRRDIVRAAERMNVSSRMYQSLVAKLEGKPEERILNYLMLRSLKQARYAAENLGHFALAAASYTHFTSPIRRYPDLIVHRLLGSLLDRQPHEVADLDGLARMCSETERRAAEAERELLEWKRVRFMTDRIGDEFEALVISTTRFGFFVELNGLFVEGLVPIDTLPGERWNYLENTRRITGERTRREISIGDQLRVRLDHIDAMEKRMVFSLAGPWARESGRKRPQARFRRR